MSVFCRFFGPAELWEEHRSCDAKHFLILIVCFTIAKWFPCGSHGIFTDHANQKTFPSPGLAKLWACHPTTSPAAFRRLVSLELGAIFYLLLSFLYCDRSGLRRSRLRLSKATSLGAFWESLRTWPFARNSVAHRWNGAICHFTCQLSDVGTTKNQHDPRRASPFGPFGSFGPFEPAVWLSHHAGLEVSAPASLGAFVHTGTGFNKSHTNQWNLMIYQRVMHIIRILFLYLFIFILFCIYIHIVATSPLTPSPGTARLSASLSSLKGSHELTWHGGSPEADDNYEVWHHRDMYRTVSIIYL